MSAVLLVDFSQLVISSCVAFSDDLKGPEPKNLIKHVCLNQLLNIKKRLVGEIILCCDSRKYWRKEMFTWYKGHRKLHRDEDLLPWDLVYETMNELKEDIRANFPYKLLEVERAEADDIIAILTKYFQDNELVHTGLIEEPRDIWICSTDSDFQQLQKYRNVRQWNNIDKREVKCANPKQYLVEHTVTGDTGDNICNICTGDDWSIGRAAGTAVRQKPFKKARLNEFYNKGIDACLNEEERNNFLRNQTLVDFDFIPSSVNSKVVQAYLDADVVGSKMKVFTYLTERRMKLLLAHAQEF